MRIMVWGYTYVTVVKESVFEVGIALRQSLSEMVVSMRLEEVAWSIL
jgi:hypothetical protein